MHDKLALKTAALRALRTLRVIASHRAFQCGLVEACIVRGLASLATAVLLHVAYVEQCYDIAFEYVILAAR